MGDPHVTCCVCLRTSERVPQFGAAVYDDSRKALRFVEFYDSLQFVHVEAFLLQTYPGEVLLTVLNDSQSLYQKLVTLVRSLDMSHDSIPLKEMRVNQETIRGELVRLSGDENLPKKLFRELEWPLACLAVNGLLEKLKIHHRPSNLGRVTISHYPVDDYVRLDRSAYSVLNIFPESGENVSLFHILDNGRSCIAQRLLKTWLRQPLVDKEAISRRHDIVSLFLLNRADRITIQNRFLKYIPDLDAIVAKLHTVADEQSIKSASINPMLQHLVKIYDSVVVSGDLLIALQEVLAKSQSEAMTSSMEELIMDPLRWATTSLEKFLQLMEKTVTTDGDGTREVTINSSLDEVLTKIAARRDKVWYGMDELRGAVEDDLKGMTQDRKRRKAPGDDNMIRLVESNEDYVLRVTKKDQGLVQGASSKYQKVRINKADYLFTTKELQNMSSKYSAICAEYAEAQESIARKAIVVASSYWPAVEKLSSVLATLDVLAGFSVTAESSGFEYTRPAFNEGETLELIGSRHPILEAQNLNEMRRVLSSESIDVPSHFVPNDIKMNKEDSRLILLTGPNMGGKSTIIRQVALVSLMSQIGSYVPCTHASVPLFKQIFCRIGASDFQHLGLSTFMSEMVESAAILHAADEHSLVVVDELGRGTSTHEGFGLAWGIADYLAQKVGCYCLFATHFHELAYLKKHIPSVATRQMEVVVDEGKLAIKYRMKDGAAECSFGLAVASLAGLPPEVVDRARAQLRQYDDDNYKELVASALSADRQDAENIVNAIKAKREGGV